MSLSRGKWSEVRNSNMGDTGPSSEPVLGWHGFWNWGSQRFLCATPLPPQLDHVLYQEKPVGFILLPSLEVAAWDSGWAGFWGLTLAQQEECCDKQCLPWWRESGGRHQDFAISMPALAGQWKLLERMASGHDGSIVHETETGWEFVIFGKRNRLRRTSSNHYARQDKTLLGLVEIRTKASVLLCLFQKIDVCYFVWVGCPC